MQQQQQQRAQQRPAVCSVHHRTQGRCSLRQLCSTAQAWLLLPAVLMQAVVTLLLLLLLSTWSSRCRTCRCTWTGSRMGLRTGRSRFDLLVP
jgi:hypothetical protein